MLNLLTVNKPIIVNGVTYPSAQDALEALKSHAGRIEILINSKAPESKTIATESAQKAPKKESEQVDIHRIEVRKYMTEKATIEFDFMQKYNNDVPMPMRRMYGEILEETKGMYKMKLHGRAERDATECSHCMRALTHPISMYYGIGPICGEHAYMAPMSVLEKIADKEELFKQADEKLRQVTWEGWVIKKAITSMNVVESKKIQKGA